MRPVTEKIIQLKLGLFFLDIIAKPQLLVAPINKALSGLFDVTTPTFPPSLDPPPGLPGEVPLIQLRSSKAENLIISIARTRIDLAMIETTTRHLTQEEINNFFEKADKFLSAVSDEKQLNRFGLIGQYFHSDENPHQRIVNKYLKSDAILGTQSIKEFGIRYNLADTCDGLEINNLVEVNGAKTKSQIDDTEETGIIIQRDLNNVPADQKIHASAMRAIIEKNKRLYSAEEFRKLI